MESVLPAAHERDQGLGLKGSAPKMQQRFNLLRR